jgi:hypothetical protein
MPWSSLKKISMPIWPYAHMLCKICITLSLSRDTYTYTCFHSSKTHIYIHTQRIYVHTSTDRKRSRWESKVVSETIYIYIYRPIDITITFEIICNPSLCWYFCRQRKCRHACSKTKVRNYLGMLRCRFHKKWCCISIVWSDIIGYAVKSYHEIW